MDCWEYLVIHLNVEPPKPAPSGQHPEPEPPAADAGQSRPVFSESFLKKEFPQFYEARSEPAPQHPAQQLQGFLNGHGEQGWILIGLFPVGVLPMLVFRRPKRSAAGVSRPPTRAMEPRRQEPEPPLKAVLARLEALEQRLATAPASPAGSDDGPSLPVSSAAAGRGGRRVAPRGRAPGSPAASADSPGGREPLQLSPEQLQALAGEPTLPGSEAALAIGLRSAASLANLGARHGYRPGLCKRGPNGRVAIYRGTGPAVGGGKERRLWSVVPAERIQA